MFGYHAHMPRIAIHIIATLIAVIAGVGGLALSATGGMRIWEAYMRFDLANERVADGLLLQLLGAVLVVIAVLTGRWSPFGLLVLGLTALVALVLSAFPLVLFSVVPQIPVSFAAWYQAIVVGAPQIVGGVVGATGIVLLTRRRRHAPAQPRRAGSAVGHVVGILVAPLLFLGGLLLLLRGLDSAGKPHLALAGIVTDPLWMLALFSGFVLIVAAVLCAHWSPFSLVLPALATLVLTLLVFLPELILPLSAHLPTAIPFFVFGGLLTASALGAGTVVILLQHVGAGRSRASIDR